MRYLLSTWLLLVSLTVFCQTDRDDIRNQLTRKRWVLVKKRSSLGGSREPLSSPSVALTFNRDGSGTCNDLRLSGRGPNAILFQWSLTVDRYDELTVKILPIGNRQIVSSNPDNFIFGPDMIRYPSKEFNVRMVSSYSKNDPNNTQTRQDDVQLRFTPVRTEKTIIHYFFN